jgi:hypothetical protein
MKTKKVISRRYYPTYYGQMNTYRSYRSYYVGGEPRRGSADRVVGTCSINVPDGWIDGPNGNPTRRSISEHNIEGFVKQVN